MTDMYTYIEVTYPMARYWADEDQAIYAAVLAALRPFGIDAQDGSGSDGGTRDITFTLPDNAHAQAALAAARTVMQNYDGSAEAYTVS